MGILVVESQSTRERRETEEAQRQKQADAARFELLVKSLSDHVPQVHDKIDRESVLRLCKQLDPGGGGRIVVEPQFTKAQVAKLIADVLLGGAEWERKT